VIFRAFSIFAVAVADSGEVRISSKRSSPEREAFMAGDNLKHFSERIAFSACFNFSCESQGFEGDEIPHRSEKIV